MSDENEPRRPKRGPAKRRYEGLESFTCRFSAEDYALLTRIAKQNKMPRTEVVRRLIKKYGNEHGLISKQAVADQPPLQAVS